MTTKFISVKSVLYDLSLTLDERYYNETKMLEWATHALRKVKANDLLRPAVCLKAVVNHKATLPNSLRYLVQVSYYDDVYSGVIPNQDIPDTSNLKLNGVTPTMPWKAMKMTSNPYHESICLNYPITYNTDCNYEYSVDENLIVTTTLPDGYIMVAYLEYPVDEKGIALMPDDEDLKEALLHYCLYRYWMMKFTMKEDGADQRMKHHLSMWNTLAAKAAGSLNLPDVNQMENLKNIFNQLVPRSNRFDQLFLTLNSRENVNF